MQFLLASVDMGTTRVKAAVFTEDGTMVASSAVPAAPLVDWRGFLAFDVARHTGCVFDVLRDVRRALDPGMEIQAVVLTNQRATVIPVDRQGLPLGPALSWQDTSGEAFMAELAGRIGPARYSSITGLPPSALWSVAKILRLRREVPEVFARAAAFVTLHDYMLHHLGGGRLVTDASNASVTGLLDIRQRCWSEELLAAAELSISMLPALETPGAVYGHLTEEAARATGLPKAARLLVGGGDQQCSAVGLGAVDQGDAALCLGTAAILSCPVTTPVPEAAGSFFCTAHVLNDRWVLEGIHNAFAGSIEWCGSVLGLSSVEDRNRAWRASPRGAKGVLFLPFLSGIGSPDYDAACAGTFLGLRPTHSAADLMRAVYEGIILETRRLLEAVPGSSPVANLFIGGGFTTGPTGQLLADILGRELVLSSHPETSLLGAAVLGWTGLRDGDDLRTTMNRMVRSERVVVSPGHPGVYDALFEEYKTQVGALRRVYAKTQDRPA